MVYLDYAASTPLDPHVAMAMAKLADIEGSYANASSNHAAGRRARALVDKATEQLAALLGCSPGELVWTSGATESDNLAIAGAARYRQDRGKHLVTMPTEHKAVTDVFHALEQQGFDVTWLHPDATGRVSLDALEQALREDSQLVSIMHVNNETGIIQDVAAIGEICRRHDVLFHVDAAQSVGKVPIDLASMPIDLLSTTAHKIYGPNGVGALYIADRPGCHVEPLIFGGGQQRSIRPGTFAVPLIVGFGQAAEVAASRIDDDRAHLASLRERFWSRIADIDGLIVNGGGEPSFPGILNVSVADVEGESLVLALEPLCVATGSACNSTRAEPSYVLRALGRSDAEAQGAIRFSFGRPTTAAEIDFAADRYRESIERLRRIAPGRAA
jgi:cysteine desulfurase